MHYEIEPHLPFHLAAKLEWLCSCRYRLHQHLVMLQRVLPTTGLYHVREPAVSTVFRRAHFCMNTLLSTGTLASIFSTRKIWRQKSTSLVCCTSTPANFSSPLLSSCSERSIQGLPSKNSSATIICVAHHLCCRIYQLSPPREHRVSSIFVGDMHLLPILQVSPMKSAHIFATSAPNLGGLSTPLVTLTSGFSRPPARPSPLWLPQLAGWSPPVPCARAPPAALESPIAFS